LQNNVSEQRLDIYAPHEGDSWPVVVFLHGSGQTKEHFFEKSQIIAEQGFVIYTITWPNWNASIAAQENGRGFREIYEVLSCAVRYAKATAADHGGDPSKVILVGYSAGARFGSWFALAGDTLIPKWEELFANRGGPPAQVSCLVGDGSSNVDAFVGIGGHYAFIENMKDKDVELYNVISPFAQVGERPDLSVRLLHGDKDNFPTSYSARLHDLLEGAGYDTELIVFDGGHIVPLDVTINTIMALTGVE
jgi:predicted esterase